MKLQIKLFAKITSYAETDEIFEPDNHNLHCPTYHCALGDSSAAFIGQTVKDSANIQIIISILFFIVVNTLKYLRIPQFQTESSTAEKRYIVVFRYVELTP